MSLTTQPQAFEQTVADLKQGVETATAAQTAASEKAMTAAKTMVAFNQSTLKAFAEATQILAAGSQDLFRQMVASNRAAFAESLSGFRAMVTAPTAKDRLELQAGFVRTAATWAVAETGRFAHAGIELAEKAAAPLTAQATAAAEALTFKA